MHFGELVHTEELDGSIDQSHVDLIDELIAGAGGS